MAVPTETRSAVLARAAGRCEYCQTPLAYSPDPVVLDHIIPTTQGGTDAPENLAASCWGCNGHKAAGTRAFDAQEVRLVNLFHPLKQRWAEQFEWSDDALRVLGRTAVGRATVRKLNLNRPGLVNLRAVLRLAGKHPPA